VNAGRHLKNRGKYVIGLMSGTSADGIDAVVAEIFSTRARLTKARVVLHVHTPFPADLRRQIIRVSLHGAVAEICELNFSLGEHFARAALKAIKTSRLKPSEIAAIGSHGQTIHHLPNAGFPSTLQIGEPSIIAERTGIKTVADFRVRDMAAGGQGAPLVSFADWALFTDPARPRIVQNIGGIGNLTFLPAAAGLNQVVAFDTGPGNMVIDSLVAKLSRGRHGFDKNGQWASQGRVFEPLLAKMMTHPFLRRSPPKTTGREEFGEDFTRKVIAWKTRWRMSNADVVATATMFTALSIAEAYRRFIFPSLKAIELSRLQIVLGGGGAKNPTMRRMLQEQLGGPGPPSRSPNQPAVSHEILTHEDFGIANAAKEALAFAILAHETLHNRPSNVPNATGGRRAVVLGKIIP
jgi:anhydro-N-acetylmuramic acid kinase